MAELSVVTVLADRPRIKTPSDVSQVELDLFERIVADCSPDHFRPSDAPLLQAYVQAVLLSRWAFSASANPEDTDKVLPIWDKATKQMASLATKLRLCPHSRTDPKTLAREKQQNQPRPWEPRA